MSLTRQAGVPYLQWRHSLMPQRLLLAHRQLHWLQLALRLFRNWMISLHACDMLVTS
jgi:hypothetical protein